MKLECDIETKEGSVKSRLCEMEICIEKLKEKLYEHSNRIAWLEGAVKAEKRKNP